MRKKGRIMWTFIYIGAFVLALGVGAATKFLPQSWAKDYAAPEWNDYVGTVHTDLSYGEKEANRFDLYVPADNTKESYGLVVYLHAGGFTSGDKSDDEAMLQWLCSKPER